MIFCMLFWCLVFASEFSLAQEKDMHIEERDVDDATLESSEDNGLHMTPFLVVHVGMRYSLLNGLFFRNLKKKGVDTDDDMILELYKFSGNDVYVGGYLGVSGTMGSVLEYSIQTRFLVAPGSCWLERSYLGISGFSGRLRVGYLFSPLLFHEPDGFSKSWFSEDSIPLQVYLKRFLGVLGELKLVDGVVSVYAFGGLFDDRYRMYRAFVNDSKILETILGGGLGIQMFKNPPWNYDKYLENKETQATFGMFVNFFFQDNDSSSSKQNEMHFLHLGTNVKVNYDIFYFDWINLVMLGQDMSVDLCQGNMDFVWIYADILGFGLRCFFQFLENEDVEVELQKALYGDAPIFSPILNALWYGSAISDSFVSFALNTTFYWSVARHLLRIQLEAGFNIPVSTQLDLYDYIQINFLLDC